MRLFLLLLTIPMLHACSEVDEELQHAEEQLHEELITQMNIAQLPTLSAAIVKPTGTSWQISEKLENFAVFQEPDAHSIYVLGQASKLFLAVAVMQLVEQELLNLDDDINQHIPYDISNRYYPDEPITIKQLLINNSSISPYAYFTPDFSFIQFANYDTVLTLEPIVRDYISPNGIKHDSTIWLPRKPGQIVEGSNLGATLLAFVVEETSGVSYGDYCRQYIFDPLEMENSGFYLDELNEDHQLEIYYTDPPLIASDLYNTTLFPAYSAKSTLFDLSHFIAAMLNSGEYNGTSVLSASSIDTMLEIQDRSTKLPFEAGAGFMWYAPNNEGWLGHSGAIFGSSTSIYLNKEKGVGMIILTNRGGRNLIHPAFPVYDLISLHAERYY